MTVDRIAGEASGLFVPDDGMDARIDDDSRTGRRITSVVTDPVGGGIYVMSTIGAPFAKIGWVKFLDKVERRMDVIQTGCPYKLQVVAKIAVESRRAETLVHKAFADQHFRGEWFRREGQVRRFVQLAVAFPELSLTQLIEKSS